jgi:putative hydrolase of the HAD superfamily
MDFFSGERQSMQVRAVIWDFGGVFTTSPFESFNRYEDQCGIPRGLIQKVNSTNPNINAWAHFERGAIDFDAFDRKFLEESTALGHPVRGADVIPLLAGDLRPRMVEAMLICKQSYKVGCITNNMAHGKEPVRASGGPAANRSADVMRHFDAIIESSKAGLRKPDPRIYLMMCERLGVEANACVYLDDLGVNCKPAAQLGMKAIKVISEAQALTDLESATGLRFP